MVAVPDIVEELLPEGCDYCEGRLHAASENIEVRQVIDFPIQWPEGIEYRSHRMQCRKCGQLYKGKFPETTQNSVQYRNQI
jgi:hypothetical protein